MKKEYSIKLAGTFLIYFVLSLYGDFLLSSLGMTNSILKMFLIDCTFLLIALSLYWRDLKDSYQALLKKKKGWVIKSVLKWLIIIFVAILIFNLIGNFLIFQASEDGNNSAIALLFDQSRLYAIFKTLIYAALAEEVLYKLSLRKVIKNNIIFLILSALIYTLLNYAFVSVTSFQEILVFGLFARFLPEIVFATAYVKSDNNIIISMLIKFFYNLIPLTLLFFA